MGHALDLVSEMLRRAWHSSDPTLAGFQERAIEMIFSAWTGGEGRDSFVITADTGSGKTEAACLPILAGTAFDHLRGVRGTRALLVYPRIRLAHNQAQRLAYYLAHLATVPDAPPLTLGVQATGVPASFDRNIPPEWDPRGEGFTFPFFECPACGKGLLLTPERGRRGRRSAFMQCVWVEFRRLGWHTETACGHPTRRSF